LVGPMLQRPWILETDPDKADFIIATQRWRSADGRPLILIDEVSWRPPINGTAGRTGRSGIRR
jgi:hypothetical protein